MTPMMVWEFRSRDRLAKGFAFGKQLLFRVAAEKSHVAASALSLLVVEAAQGRR